MSEHFVYGLHAVSAVLANPHRTIYKIFISQERGDKRLQDIINKAQKATITLETLSLQAADSALNLW